MLRGRRPAGRAASEGCPLMASEHSTNVSRLTRGPLDPGQGTPASTEPAFGFCPTDANGSQVLSLVGDYRMLQRIGAGTFGEVWKAEAPGGTQVAVKIIRRPFDEREAQQELHALEHVK